MSRYYQNWEDIGRKPSSKSYTTNYSQDYGGSSNSDNYPKSNSRKAPVKLLISISAFIIIAFLVFMFWKPLTKIGNGISSSFLVAVSGAIKNGTRSIEGSLAPQSNLAYIMQNGNDSIAIFNTNSNKIIGEINLIGKSPTDIVYANSTDMLYATGSYYNYHNPQFHGVISIINTTIDSVIGNISMIAVPTQIVVSKNGTYAYTINNNGSLSEIDLITKSVITTLPDNITLNLAPINPTANCTYSQISPTYNYPSGSEINESCNGISGLKNKANRWTVSIYNETSLISGSYVLNRTYNTASFTDNYTYPVQSPYGSTTYISTVTAYTDNSTFLYRFNFSTNNGRIYEHSNQFTPTIQPTDILYALNGTRLYVIANYSYQCNIGSVQFCYNETVYSIDTKNNQVMSRSVLDVYPDYSSQAAMLSINGSKLYLLGGNGTDNYLTLYSLNSSTGTITAVSTVDSYADDQSNMALTPVGDYLYVASVSNYDAGNIKVIKTTTSSIVDTVNTQSIAMANRLISYQPTDLLVTSNYTYVLGNGGLGNGGNDLMLVLSRENDSVIETIGISGCPCVISN